LERKYKFNETDFFKVPIDSLVPGQERLFPLFHYFRLNDHLVLLRRESQDIEQKTIAQFKAQGVTEFWCPNEFKEIFESTLGANSDTLIDGNVNADDDEISAEELAEMARSEEAALAIDVLDTNELTPEQKKRVLGEVSQNLISNLYNLVSDDPEEVQDAMKKCQEFAEDIVQLGLQSRVAEDFWEEIKSIREEVGLEHSTSTSTFAVIFALGVGYTEPDILADLSIAGLLHDIGFVKLDYSLLGKPENEFTDEERTAFSKHVELGLEIIQEQEIDIPEEVKEIIAQHHECFDGSGYPQRIEGFQINELSQIISLADLFDDLMTGRSDGQERDPVQAMKDLQSLQLGENDAPKYFDPELFERFSQLVEGGQNKALENEEKQVVSEAKAA